MMGMPERSGKKPAAITAASFTQIFPPLFGCLCVRAPGGNW
jgi:hypothetical protein